MNSSSQHTVSQENIHEEKLKVYTEWSKEKLLSELTTRLLERCKQPLSDFAKGNESLYPVIHQGIYSENVLKTLRESGNQTP